MLDQIEEKEEINVISFALKQGLYLGLFLIIFSIIINMAGLSLNLAVGSLAYGVLLGVLIWSMVDYKKENDNYMSFGQGLGLGTLLSLIGAAISSAFSVFYMTVIDPGFVDRALATGRANTEERYPQLTDEQIEASMKVSEWIMQPAVIFTLGLIIFTFIGAVFSLILAAIMQKTRPNPF